MRGDVLEELECFFCSQHLRQSDEIFPYFKPVGNKAMAVDE
jgi:hypothetical protein